MDSFATIYWKDVKGVVDEDRAAARRKRNQASLLKTMKKYGDAAKMGIDAKDVNQRRNAPTRKKR
jgi:hypothetical protein